MAGDTCVFLIKNINSAETFAQYKFYDISEGISFYTAGGYTLADDSAITATTVNNDAIEMAENSEVYYFVVNYGTSTQSFSVIYGEGALTAISVIMVLAMTIFV